MRIVVTVAIYLFSSLYAVAQVPVSKEPRHHPVFENDKVRILNVLLPPGDTTQYHVHSTPSVFISFTRTLTGSQLKNSQPDYSTSVAGNVWYEDLSEPHIKIHRVWNMDTSAFHVMDIELLKKETRFISNPPAIPNALLQIDTSWARTYAIHLANNESVNINEQPYDFILIAIDDAKIKLMKNGKESTLFTKPGWFYWINANEKFSFFNAGNSPADFRLIGIK